MQVLDNTSLSIVFSCRIIVTDHDTKRADTKRSNKPMDTYTKTPNILNPYSKFLTDPKFPDDKMNAALENNTKSLPRNCSSVTKNTNWTLLDTEVAKVKGIFDSLCGECV